jgi:hypothetical protein
VVRQDVKVVLLLRSNQIIQGTIPKQKQSQGQFNPAVKSIYVW